MRPVLIDDLDALQTKLTGPLCPQWEMFLDLTSAYADKFPEYAALAYLGTGERSYAAAYRQHLLRLIDTMAEADYTELGQFHTWTHCFAPARQALMMDWVEPAGVLTEAEHRQFAEAIIDYTYKHAYLHAHSRYPMSDNQIANMVAACLFVGYYFGIHTGDDARAQRLYSYGLRRFPELLGHCNPGGYGGEGSGYNNSCLAPVIAMMAWLLEWQTGRDYFRRRYRPNDVSVLDMLEMVMHIHSPGGLTVPWGKGFRRCDTKTPLVMLARWTNCYEPLAIIEQLDLWNIEGRMGFGNDDRLWSLIFWPDEELPASNPFPSWREQHTAAGLVAPQRKMRLFQMWDRCGAGLYVVREQVNPNAVILEADGSPFFMDGTASPKCALFHYPTEVFDRFISAGLAANTERYLTADGSAFDRDNWLLNMGVGYGTVGASNSVVIDDQGYYTPETPRTGHALAFGRTESLAAVTADATDFYRPHYDLALAQRTSLMVNDEYYIISDRLQATTPHDYRHQFFLRREVSRSATGLVVDTPEMNRLHFVAEDSAPAQLDDADGFPLVPEPTSVRALFATHGTASSIAFLLWPEPRLETLLDLDGTWEHQADGEDSIQQVEIAHACRQTARYGPDTVHTFSRTFTYEEADPEGLYLWINLWLEGSGLMINGHTVIEPKLGEGPHKPAMTPQVFDVSQFLTSGENRLEIVTVSPDGATIGGPIRLMRQVETGPPPHLTRVADYVLEVSRGDRTDTIVCDNHDHRLVQAGDLTTDARASVHSQGTVSFLEATQVRGGEWRLDADVPVSGEVSTRVICLNDGFAGSLHLTTDQSQLILHSGDALTINYCGAEDLTIKLSGWEDRIILVNGELAESQDYPEGRLVRLAATTEGAPTGDETTWSDRANRAVRLAFAATQESLEELLELARYPDWRVQVAAVESLGERRESAAVPLLLELLEHEEAAELYPPVIYNYRGVQTDEEAPLTLEAARRWRLKMVLIEALGSIGDRRAVPAIETILLRADDFYPVTSVAAEALGEIGDAASIPTLLKAADHPEHNTMVRAQRAVDQLTDRVQSQALPYPGEGIRVDAKERNTQQEPA